MQCNTRQWWTSMAGAVALTVSATASNAAVLYLGLPNGRSIAYSTVGGAMPWKARATSDLPDVGGYAAPTFADLDGDGDHDALVGENGGLVQAWANVGSDAAPVWERRAAWDPGLDVGSAAAPALGDIDGDGDADLLIGAASGAIVAFANVGGVGGPKWQRRTAWDFAGGAQYARPAFGRLDGDARLDLLVGTAPGDVYAFLATGDPSAPFVRAPGWDLPRTSTRTNPGLGDLDGDGDFDVIVADGSARSVAYENTGRGWKLRSDWAIADPGSGPAVPALRPGELSATPPPPPPPKGGSAPIAKLTATPVAGPPPLRVQLDASGSSDADGDALAYSWSFGDGLTGGPPAPSGNPAVGIKAAPPAYTAARSKRDGKKYPEAVSAYLALVTNLVPLTAVQEIGPIARKGTNRIDRVARWYLQKIAHDLGGIYLFNDVDRSGCERYAASLRYSRESKAQAIAGGFPKLPELNGTVGNIKRAEQKLRDGRCAIPPEGPVFASTMAIPAAGARADHEYLNSGTYTARVTVTAGGQSTTASVTITVGDDVLPPPPGGPDDNDADPLEGFGADTPGGAGGRVVIVSEPTEAAVRAAIQAANAGRTIVRFDTPGPIQISKSLPRLEGSFVTIEGNGATLVARSGASVNLIDVRGSDVIVRNLRLRNGSDNLRAQGNGAQRIVFSHVSSTGASDDGISIGYGARDVTVQYCFLAGNTRSIFLKYGSTTNVSVHHTWIMKQWIRGPLVSGSAVVDLRNLIVEDWTLWGTRFEASASGNIVNSLFVLGTHARAEGGKADSALRLQQSGPVFVAGNTYEGYAVAAKQASSPTPVDVPPVTTHAGAEMRDRVRGRAGCLPRDAVDQAYVERQDQWDVTESKAFRIGEVR
ncbi:MAG: VCBS repeat-containing protein [bacterium]|nr:VCBS repeat-containing protein [bacterium]